VPSAAPAFPKIPPTAAVSVLAPAINLHQSFIFTTAPGMALLAWVAASAPAGLKSGQPVEPVSTGLILFLLSTLVTAFQNASINSCLVIYYYFMSPFIILLVFLVCFISIFFIFQFICIFLICQQMIFFIFDFPKVFLFHS